VELGQHPASEQGSDRVAEHRGGRDRADRPCSFLFIEQNREQRKHHRQQQRAAQSEQGAGGDEGACGWCDGARDRGGAEDQQRDDQHPLAPIAVAEHSPRH
jgi:hypothetical protein